MPLGQGIGELWDAVRDRVEVSGDGPTWEVTAGSFDSALAYAREAYGDPVVLARRDRVRWWPRVTLTVSTDPAHAAAAPDLAELAHPVIPVQKDEPPRTPIRHRADGSDATRHRGVHRTPRRRADVVESRLPASLEAIFAHQDELRRVRGAIPEQAGPPEGR